MRVVVAFGTRPEAIKLAPVLTALEALGADVVVAVTAQHREMLDQVLDLFGIRPTHDLGVMAPDQSPSVVASRVLAGMEGVLRAEATDWVVVQGDTTSAMAAALAAFYGGARVAHVEAGLRTGRPRQPFPEEMNRRVVSAVADVHLAPTERARRNLLAEGIDDEDIVVTGNTIVDAVTDVAARVEAGPLLAGVGPDQRIVLVTAHRRESFGPPLASICAAVRELVARHHDVVAVYPVHLNPNVRDVVTGLLGGHDRIRLLPPLGYGEFVAVLARSYLVLTDSGGVQEEAPSLGKPALVLRDVTERPEAVDAGWARVVGTDAGRIIAEASRLLTDPAAHAAMCPRGNPFGDGHAAERVAAALLARSR